MTDSIRTAVRAVLQTVRSGDSPTAMMVAPLLGRRPAPAELAVATNMLASLEAWPLEEAVDVACDYVAQVRASEDVLAQKHRSVEALFESARTGRPLHPIMSNSTSASFLRFPVLLALGAVLLPACDDGGDAEPSQSGPETCAELAPVCAETQQVCVESDEGPACEFCPDGSFIEGDACAPIEGVALSHTFAEYTTQPGEEVKDLCQSWTLNNPEELWVTAVEMRQNYGSHHSTWVFVPDDVYDGPDGVWWCDDRDFSVITSAVAGGNLYNQSTQTERETQVFADGAAIRIPPYSRILADIHLLNTTPEPLTGAMSLTLYSKEREEIETPLVPVELEFHDVFVPAEKRSKMVVECDLDESFALVDEPVDFTVYHALPHAHERGRRLFIEVMGGPNDGTMILDDRQYGTFEPRGYNFVDPLEIKGATGLRFGCEFENNDPWDYVWGFNYEMCQFSMFVDSKLGFTAGAYDLALVGEEDGMEVRQSQECIVTAAVWEHDKPGGPGPDGDSGE